MTKTFLGLTVSCARCHDHKFDAISARDYYALFGFLESSSYRLVRFDTLEQDHRLAAELTKLRRQHAPELRRAIAAAIRPTAQRLCDYLLASREALLAGPDEDAKPSQSFAARYRRRAASVAESRGLRADVLGEWMAHLVSSDSDDPFHAWARAASDARTREPSQLAEALAAIATTIKAEKEPA